MKVELHIQLWGEPCGHKKEMAGSFWGQWSDRCRLTPIKVAFGSVFCILTLLAAYSHIQVNVRVEEITTLTPQEIACQQNALDHSIPWQLKDQHIDGGVTDILRLERPDYAKDFKNPCWRDQTQRGIKVHCLPYFFIAGMPKSGTTDLWNSVSKHPEVRTLLGKEPHWWTRFRYSKGISMEQYVKRFDKSANEIRKNFIKRDGQRYHTLITGEGSASTLWDNIEWRRIPQNCNSTQEPLVTHAHLIRHLLPNARIIVILRNPVDRLYSGYLYFSAHNNKSQEEFHMGCLSAIANWRSCVERYSPRYCVYNRISNLTTRVKVRIHLNMYAIHVKEWLQVFPREQLHFIRLKDYSSNRAKVLQKVFKFLDLDPLEDTEFINDLPIKNQRRDSAKKIGPMLDKTRALLEDFYKPYNEELAHLLQDDRLSFTDAD